MKQNTILLIILVLCWTLNPFFKKQLSNKLDSEEQLIFNHGLCTLLIVLYFIYIIAYNKYELNNINKLSTKDIIISTLGAFITVLASILLIKILKDEDVSSIIPQIQPCIIVLSLFIGIFLYGEEFTYNKIIGTGLVTFGIIFLNSK
tara:strand:- start:45 stop:485 length:441 start_codon:yes stop_codon:yes gene_type:complete